MISAWLNLILVSILYTGDTGASTCSKENVPLEEGRITGNIIMSVTTDGPVSCASSCLLLTLCESFSHEAATGLCELSSADAKPANIRHQVGFVVSNVGVWPSRLATSCANHACSANEMCEPQSQRICNTIGCLLSERPDIDNATVNTNIFDVIVREETVLSYKCDKNELSAEAVCKLDGSWKSTPCHLAEPSSCVDVQKCLPTSTDGEYWLTLPTFDFYRTRIYCYGMASDNPKAYLTLPNPNYGSCLQKQWLGFSWFRKIRVHLKTMTVWTVDDTFANLTYPLTHYAQAYDWYIPGSDKTYKHHRSCGSSGYFIINLSGTGWIVRPSLTWIQFGRIPIVPFVSRSANGSVVKLRCGGSPGRCLPNGALTLVPNILDYLKESSV